MISLDLDFLHQIERIAILAGDAIMEIYAQNFGIDFKDDKSPVTLADQRANGIILNELRQLQSDIPILSEESSEFFSQDGTPDEYFLVDPLDGTKEFINKNDEFTVNIAFIQSGESVLGVVYAPALKVMYSSLRGMGAYKTQNGEQINIAIKPMNSFPRILVSRSHIDPKTEYFLSHFELYEKLSMGSSLKICLVADGGADIYPRFGPTSLWDTAAAQAILEEAGGVLMNLNGQSLSYASTSKILNDEFVATSCDSSFILAKIKHL